MNDTLQLALPNISSGNNNPALENFTLFTFSLLTKNCTLKNFKVTSLFNSTECRAPKYTYNRDLSLMDTPKWYSANERFQKVLMVFFATAIIDVVHSLIRMVRGLSRKDEKPVDQEGEAPKDDF